MSPADRKRFVTLRRDAGLSQTALAHRAGLSQSAVSQIESGERDPSFSTCVRIAKALGVTHAQLVGGAQIVAGNPWFKKYDALTTAQRRELREFADYLASQRRTKPRRRAPSSEAR